MTVNTVGILHRARVLLAIHWVATPSPEWGAVLLSASVADFTWEALRCRRIRAAVRGALQRFIEATTPYKVCDAVDNDVSVIHKATENHCDLIVLHLTMPLQDSLVTVSVRRDKLPHVKIVGFSTLSVDIRDLVSPTIGFDAVLTWQDGLSKLVEILKALMPEPPESNRAAP